MVTDHLLVDAKNAVYRAVYSWLSDENCIKTGYPDPIVVLMRFLSVYLTKFKPGAVHIFWDCPKEQVWRRKILPEYKNDRDVGHDGRYDKEHVRSLVERCSVVLQELSQDMQCRNYKIEKQEADDLIYAFCKENYGKQIIIVSSDGDFKQIVYRQPSISVYNPLAREKQLLTNDDCKIDPVEMKAFMGEDTDNISGYYQIGPVRAEQLVRNGKKALEFFQTHDQSVYMRNKALIDLSLCPYLLSNCMYVFESMVSDIKFDDTNLRQIIKKHNVRGLMGEYSRVILPFKFLGKG